jgi:hypothetical protein
MPESEAWKLVGTEARLDFAGLRATVDLTQPEYGLDAFFYQGRRLDATTLLGVRFPCRSAPPIADAYVRRQDLVLTYAQTPELQFRCQIYWRAAFGPHDFPAIDLQVSVQTSLLDSHPRLWTTTSFCDAEPIRFGRESEGPKEPASPRYDLFRPTESETSYVEMIHPADDVGGSTIAGGRGPSGSAEMVSISRDLFGSFLEKGVILRARLRGAFLPRERDAELAAEAYRQFLATPPPLTT